MLRDRGKRAGAGKAPNSDSEWGSNGKTSQYLGKRSHAYWGFSVGAAYSKKESGWIGDGRSEIATVGKSLPKHGDV